MEILIILAPIVVALLFCFKPKNHEAEGRHSEFLYKIDNGISLLSQDDRDRCRGEGKYANPKPAKPLTPEQLERMLYAQEKYLEIKFGTKKPQPETNQIGAIEEGTRTLD